MRLLVDLQACQTEGSAHRGVGRYSKSLFQELEKNKERFELFGLASDELPYAVDWTRSGEERMLRPPRLPIWDVGRDFEGGQQDSLDGLLYSSVAATARADILHVSHLFEGYSDRVPISSPKSRPMGQVFSATLYDLIPLRFSAEYFHDARFKAWYMERVQLLRQADLLLSISESSRQDAIEILDLDPERIVTIHGGIGDHFRPASDAENERARIAAKYSITRERFVLYTGGDDYRKNIQGALDAYAALPESDRDRTQFVIVCALQPHRKSFFEESVRRLRLKSSDVIFLGFIPEADLVALYASCDLFVFPSKYEGLGLPVIEAMACGAPVIGGDNSSIREIIGRADAMFDAEKVDDIADAMHRVLNYSGFADELRRYGKEQARKFNWQSSAAAATEAFGEALARKRSDGERAAGAGWLARNRIAMLTPLPPTRSGIADYNAGFLPFLAEHFDIDLYVQEEKISDAEVNAAFRIFPVSDFADNALSYDAVVYEFGNSEFHAHMLELLERFPGIVGLHDAYLSGLFGYLQFHQGEAHRFEREMLSSHAGQARALLAPFAAHPDGYGAAMIDLPCTKRVIGQAIGIISHSVFNLETARRFYPEGWQGPYRIVPQMVQTVEDWTNAQKTDVRGEFGFGADDVLIMTFGHVAWNKCGDRLLDAFLNSPLQADKRYHLIFAGELAKDEFGLQLNDRIRRANLGRRIEITGYLSVDDYAKYLRIADIALQLRIKSRGGTPKGVLDCLAYGVPVVVNAEASYEDYPDEAVIKLDRDPTAEEIAQLLLDCLKDATFLRAQSQRGLDYVRRNHGARFCARQYSVAIREMMERDRSATGVAIGSQLAPHIAGCPNPVNAAVAASEFIARHLEPSFQRSRIVIDASHIAKGDHGTGIPRVMREITRAGYLDPRPGFEIVAVRRADDDLIVADDWLASLDILMPFERERKEESVVRLRPGDHLLMLDSSWSEFEHFSAVFDKAREARVPITTVIYDLLPLVLPESDVYPGGKAWFDTWVRLAIRSSDNLICISRSAADELIAYIEQNDLGAPGLKVGYWHLGSSFANIASPGSIAPVERPYALMVGTIEPRKNHALALDAFERLWEQGSNLSLVMAGRLGWLTDPLIERISHHPERNRRLFFIEGATDANLVALYGDAEFLLFLSKGEGFGLPLVEAAHYGTPIVCSDIPVFREIAGDHATFVDVRDADQVAKGILEWQARAAGGERMSSAGMSRLSWQESAHSLFGTVRDGGWYWEKV